MATKEEINIQSIALHVVQMGNLQVHVWIGFLQNLSGTVLLGGTCISKCIVVIFSIEHKIIPMRLAAVEILATGKEIKVTTILLHEKLSL